MDWNSSQVPPIPLDTVDHEGSLTLLDVGRQVDESGQQRIVVQQILAAGLP
jgi:hypothetical protein